MQGVLHAQLRVVKKQVDVFDVDIPLVGVLLLHAGAHAALPGVCVMRVLS